MGRVTTRGESLKSRKVCKEELTLPGIMRKRKKNRREKRERKLGANEEE